jgi:hypothetical protein|nr:MAG TPA: hypothetical protein [Caudoviricetes sp.]
MKAQITYDYITSEGEFNGYDEFNYLGSISKENFEDDMADFIVAWLKHRDKVNGTTHNCEYDFLGDELFFDEFKDDEKVGTIAEVEVEFPSLGIIFKL